MNPSGFECTDFVAKVAVSVEVLVTKAEYGDIAFGFFAFLILIGDVRDAFFHEGLEELSKIFVF